MHLISQCFTVGFPCHPRKQKSLAAKRNCVEGHHGDQMKTSLGLCACLGQAMPMLHTPDPRGAIPWLGTGDIGVSALLMHAFFSTSCTASVSLPASCPMHHASFLLCLSCMLSALCSTIRLLQRAGWGRHIHANKIDELPGRARYSFSNWHNSGFADLAPGGERGRLVN